MAGTQPIRSACLQEGTLGEDPYNARLTESALGGLPLLQAQVLMVLPINYIHLMDPGVAILAMPLVFLGMARRRGWPDGLAGLLILFMLVLRTHWINASALTMPSLLLLSAYDMLEERAARGSYPLGDLLAIALCSAAVLTMKQTMIPGTVLFLALFFAMASAVGLHRSVAIRAGLIVGLATVLLLAPWMIFSQRATGTPLYPLLGEGYRTHGTTLLPHLSAVSGTRQRINDLVKIACDPRTLLFFGLGALAVAASCRDGFRRGRGLAFLGALRRLLRDAPALRPDLQLLSLPQVHPQFLRRRTRGLLRGAARRRPSDGPGWGGFTGSCLDY